MTVRAARTPDDFEAADNLVADVYRQAGLPGPPPIGPDECSVVLLAEQNDDAVGTIALVLHGPTAVACRFAIKRKSVLWAWPVLVAGTLGEMQRRKIEIMATTVNPATERRWKQSLGLVVVSRGSYEVLDGVPAVVMVGSVGAMCDNWDLYTKS